MSAIRCALSYELDSDVVFVPSQLITPRLGYCTTGPVTTCLPEDCSYCSQQLGSDSDIDQREGRC